VGPATIFLNAYYCMLFSSRVGLRSALQDGPKNGYPVIFGITSVIQHRF